MKVLSKALLKRDQGVTEFSAILLRLCDNSGALGAALVDAEGETVDYAGRVDAFDVRVAAAEYRLLLGLIDEAPCALWPALESFTVRGQRHSFTLYALSEGYALVAVLPRCCFRVSNRAVAEAAREIEKEAGLTFRFVREGHRWSRVEIRPARASAKRPIAIWQEGVFRAVTILGRVDAKWVGPGERGYLARLDNGAELLLVREPLGKWFAAEPL